MFLKVFHSNSLKRRQSLVKRAIELDTVSLQTPQIGELVIRLTLLPAAPENPQPFEGDLAQGCPRALSLLQGLVEQELGPGALGQRTLGELDDALVQKDRAGTTELDKFQASTLFADGS